MPSTSPKQARLMAAVAHGWHKPGGGGPSVAVAKEFNAADKGTPMARAKSYGTFNASYAAGGPVLGRTRDFLKEPDEFRTDGLNAKRDAADQDYGKKGKGEQGASKTLKAVKPRG